METDKPKAPGLKWRRRKHGPDVPLWAASEAAVKAGYPVKTVRLDFYAASPAELVRRCERLQNEMRMWLSGQHGNAPVFDGTFGKLIAVYQTDPESPYHKLKPSSRHPYDVYAKRLIAHIGAVRIADTDGRDLKRWFKVWCDSEADGPPKIAAARMAVTVIKSAIRFGIACRFQGCVDFGAILQNLDFPALRPRSSAPTAEDIVKARQAAHAAGAPSRALAYALQFESTARQWDIIGQWVPMSDPRPSTLFGYGEKWIGPIWERVDANMILRVTPTKTERSSEARVVIDMRECPMVLEELTHVPPERRTGPLIVNEKTGLPYRHPSFRDAWKEDFAAAGLPKAMWNRDLRAGGNTEGQKAGARLEDRAKVAGHSRERTTADVYDRDVLEAFRRVMRARVKGRNGPGT